MSEIPEDGFLFYGKKREGFNEEYLKLAKKRLAKLVDEKKSKEEKYLDYLISQVKKVGTSIKLPFQSNGYRYYTKLQALRELKLDSIQMLERAKERIKDKSVNEQVKILESQKHVVLGYFGFALYGKILDFDNWLKEREE